MQPLPRGQGKCADGRSVLVMVVAVVAERSRLRLPRGWGERDSLCVMTVGGRHGPAGLTRRFSSLWRREDPWKQEFRRKTMASTRNVELSSWRHGYMDLSKQDKFSQGRL